jgi:hypothetical protein
LFSQCVRRRRRLRRVEVAFAERRICNTRTVRDRREECGQERLLFLAGLEHSGGDSGDQAARDDSLALGAEIISQAGDDVALAGG